MANSDENTNNREYEEGVGGTNPNRTSPTLKEYKDKEVMTTPKN